MLEESRIIVVALNQDRTAIYHHRLPRAESFLHQKQIGLCDLMSFAGLAGGIETRPGSEKLVAQSEARARWARCKRRGRKRARRSDPGDGRTARLAAVSGY